MSVNITGIDHQVWTAYGAIDTYFGSNDIVETCQSIKTRAGHPDPVAGGQLTGKKIYFLRRHYYFELFEIRINQVRREWQAIADKVETAVDQYVNLISLSIEESYDFEDLLRLLSIHSHLLLHLFLSSL
jgi:hypothetical protein